MRADLLRNYKRKPVTNEIPGRRVIVELRPIPGENFESILELQNYFAAVLDLDLEYSPVPITSDPTADQESHTTFVVRGTIRNDKLDGLLALERVANVYADSEVIPFSPDSMNADCDPNTPKGNLHDVCRFLGVLDVWNSGFRGDGVFVGIVDGGITASGRKLKAGEGPLRLIDGVIGGWPDDWGTTASAWGEHGNMTAAAAVGVAPHAKIFDIRISTGGWYVSNAIKGYNWALSEFRRTGRPQVLSNSWGLPNSKEDPDDYAFNPRHPFTLKVTEAIYAGMIVLFSAGNCGPICPEGRCFDDVGPKRSILGANGHPLVLTLSAVNPLGQYVGYSSIGPAALTNHKPDLCSVTHFANYFLCDSGTSAACPIAAGIAALLKQARPDLVQATLKEALCKTARDIGPPGWDFYTGFGIINAFAALKHLAQPASAMATGLQ